MQAGGVAGSGNQWCQPMLIQVVIKPTWATTPAMVGVYGGNGVKDGLPLLPRSLAQELTSSVGRNSPRLGAQFSYALLCNSERECQIKVIKIICV